MKSSVLKKLINIFYMLDRHFFVKLGQSKRKRVYYWCKGLKKISQGDCERCLLMQAPIQVPVSSGQHKVPDWVLADMREIGRKIDPQIYPTADLLSRIMYYTTPITPEPGRAYAHIMTSIDGSFSHCFLLPWIKRGGSDLGSIYHIEEAASIPENRVIVFLTENSDSPWLQRLPSNVTICHFGEMTQKISFEEQVVVLTRILVQMAPKVIHIIQSRHAWKAVSQYGLAIKQQSRIFVSLFNYDYTQDGIPAGYADFLPQAYKWIEKVFTDTQAYPNLLSRKYGYPSDLFKTMYFPAKSMRSISDKSQIKRNILWAGRFDRQKRLDILRKIAETLTDCRFLVFGQSVVDNEQAELAELKKLPNVSLLGAFEGFDSLPIEECDLLLYTSQWDGLPLILLDSASSGLPAVAPDIGGISELISKDSGCLIDSFDDVEAYVRVIRQLLSSPEQLREVAEKNLAIIKECHNADHFKIQLASVSGYLRP